VLLISVQSNNRLINFKSNYWLENYNLHKNSLNIASYVNRTAEVVDLVVLIDTFLENALVAVAKVSDVSATWQEVDPLAVDPAEVSNAQLDGYINTFYLAIKTINDGFVSLFNNTLDQESVYGAVSSKLSVVTTLLPQTTKLDVLLKNYNKDPSISSGDAATNAILASIPADRNLKTTVETYMADDINAFIDDVKAFITPELVAEYNAAVAIFLEDAAGVV
jgi:hypothetical protein